MDEWMDYDCGKGVMYENNNRVEVKKGCFNSRMS